MREVYDIALANDFLALSYFDSGQNSPDGSWDLDGERLAQFAQNLKRPENAHPGR